jgi:putative phage-type endonuclease
MKRKIKMIEQRSAEWFKQRVGLITGSKVGGILGLCPFNKPDDIMRTMVREFHGAESEFTGNIATRYGVSNEDSAIFALENEIGIEVVETGFHVSDDWLGASPDGLVGDKSVIEVKCPFGKRNATSSDDFKSLGDQPNYYAQMQIEMLCTETIECHFYQWAENASKYELVPINWPWLEENLPKLKDFHESYKNIIEDESLSAPYLESKEVDKSLDAEWVKLEESYINATNELNTAKEKLENIKEELLALGNGRKCVSTSLTKI